MRTAILTSLTLLAFAANSILCRLALGGHLIDPVSFTTIRLCSGALALALLASAATEAKDAGRGTWGSGLALFGYAIAFSLAYVSLGAGTGALLLFGAVQATMIGAALLSGERLRPMQWGGLAAALGGLAYLMLPGLSAPDPRGALLMGLAGLAWGFYTIRGRGVSAPVAMTAGNFLRAAPMALAASLLSHAAVRLTLPGVLYAVLSGALTSGLGYVLWYTALRGLTTTQAAVAQLLVPVLAALGGVAFLSERLSLRLGVASAMILGGVALAVRRRAAAPARG